MSTLKVNSIQSFTASDPVTISDSLTVTNNTILSGSVTVGRQSSTATLHVMGDITASNQSTVLMQSASVESRLRVGGETSVFGEGNYFKGDYGSSTPLLLVTHSIGSFTRTALKVGGGKTVIDETLEVNAITASFANLPTADPGVAGRLFTQLGSQLGLGSITASIATKKFVFVSA